MYDHLTAFKDDIARIIRVAKSAKIKLTPKVACNMWELVSEDYAAGWLILPEKDSTLLNTIKTYYKQGVRNCPRCGSRLK